MAIDVHPTGCDVGAEIKGVDLAKPLAADAVAQIEDASGPTKFYCSAGL